MSTTSKKQAEFEQRVILNKLTDNMDTCWYCRHCAFSFDNKRNRVWDCDQGKWPRQLGLSNIADSAGWRCKLFS